MNDCDETCTTDCGRCKGVHQRDYRLVFTPVHRWKFRATARAYAIGLIAWQLFAVLYWDLNVIGWFSLAFVVACGLWIFGIVHKDLMKEREHNVIMNKLTAEHNRMLDRFYGTDPR